LKTQLTHKDQNSGNLTSAVESEKITVTHLQKEIERFSLDNGNLRKALAQKEQEIVSYKFNSGE